MHLHGRVEYNSAFPEFDRPATDPINNTFSLEVKDAFGDGKPGVVEFEAEEEAVGVTNRSWIAEGRFLQTCGRNADRSDFNNGTAPGSVTVKDAGEQ